MVEWIETHPVIITILITLFSALISAIFAGIAYLVKNGISIKKDLSETIINQQKELEKLTNLYKNLQDRFDNGMSAFKSVLIDLRDQKLLSPETDLKVKSWLEEN